MVRSEKEVQQAESGSSERDAFDLADGKSELVAMLGQCLDPNSMLMGLGQEFNLSPLALRKFYDDFQRRISSTKGPYIPIQSRPLNWPFHELAPINPEAGAGWIFDWGSKGASEVTAGEVKGDDTITAGSLSVNAMDTDTAAVEDDLIGYDSE